MNYFKITGTGKYLPENIVYSSEIDTYFGYEKGHIYEKHGVSQRRRAIHEKVSDLAVHSLKEALNEANVTFNELDLLIFASVSVEFPLPNTSAYIQKKMGFEDSGVPCMDVNMSCLGFLSALEVASSLVQTNKYNRIAICCSEIPSKSLNTDNEETYALFGDGSASFIIEKDESKTKGMLYSKFKTFSKGFENTIIKGGGSFNHPRVHKDDLLYTFQMKGRQTLISTIRWMDEFVEEVQTESQLYFNDVAYVVPHQASKAAIEYFKNKYKIEHKMMDQLKNYGNCVSASIPMALYDALKEKKIKSGDKVVLIGTAAGVTLGITYVQF
jgi:3-oxoacyl-[acyl-carrier-protein] synthase-3